MGKELRRCPQCGSQAEASDIYCRRCDTAIPVRPTAAPESQVDLTWWDRFQDRTAPIVNTAGYIFFLGLAVWFGATWHARSSGLDHTTPTTLAPKEAAVVQTFTPNPKTPTPKLTPTPKSTSTPRPTPAPTVDRSGERKDAIEAVAYGEIPIGSLGRYKSIKMFIAGYEGMGYQITELGWDAKWIQEAKGGGWVVTFSLIEASQSVTITAEWYFDPKSKTVTPRNDAARMFDYLDW